LTADNMSSVVQLVVNTYTVLNLSNHMIKYNLLISLLLGMWLKLIIWLAQITWFIPNNIIS
jgi:hypothetical protein